ncbi:RNP-1 like RNA-binding protein [Nitzschia inconspicua]|uniref:RNP-1 like RNA-binding protein n=1 Tax=Nitzschia inconspicua TaxID=303405 RepID=A0A9K3KRW7_9STRA|nr:RNP-1 like RNA-binding protein [Nitzschia inconspicua]
MSYYGHGGGGDGGDATTSASPPPTTSSSRRQQQQQQHHSKSAASGGSGGGGGGGGGLDQGKIFVGGLSWSTTEESLRFHFEQYGPVETVQVMRDRNTGEPRGFGFVVFTDPATVDLVMDDVPKGHEINHKLVDVKRAQARGIAPPSIHRDETGTTTTTTTTEHTTSTIADNNNNNNNNNTAQHDPHDGDQHHDSHLTPEQLCNKVFVGGIPPHIDSEGLKEIFEEFGPVVDAIIMVDQVTNRSRCFGFVTFEHGSNGAQKAIAKQPLNIQGRNVEVKLATPKAEQRRAPPAAGPKHVGLRAGISSSNSSGEYAGLAVAYGRSGWKAGYGTYAFGKAGWGVQGWEDFNMLPERAGFSFDMLAELPMAVHQTNFNDNTENNNNNETVVASPPSKRARH